jgi:hypothetical protein
VTHVIINSSFVCTIQTEKNFLKQKHTQYILPAKPEEYGRREYPWR